MTRGRLHGIVTLLFLALTACASTRSGSDDAGVRSAMNGFMDALNALDIGAMTSYFADDVTAFVPLRQAERVEGKAALVEIFRKYVDATKKVSPRTNLVPENMMITSSGDSGVVTFQVRSAERVNRRTFVFRRINGRWLIAHFHASDLPGQR